VDPWTEQWKRVQRWFSHLSDTNRGRTHDRESDYYQDEAYAFFQNCYHLKDWLKHDRATSALVSDVETVISNSQNLSLCADLCNGSKHLTLTRPRTHADTQIGKRHFELGLSTTLGSDTDEPATIAVKYEIRSGGSVYDAFTVAEACVREWEAYLSGKGLL
jgi:hypothetical protein